MILGFFEATPNIALSKAILLMPASAGFYGRPRVAHQTLTPNRGWRSRNQPLLAHFGTPLGP